MVLSIQQAQTQVTKSQVISGLTVLDTSQPIANVTKSKQSRICHLFSILTFHLCTTDKKYFEKHFSRVNKNNSNNTLHSEFSVFMKPFSMN